MFSYVSVHPSIHPSVCSHLRGAPRPGPAGGSPARSSQGVPLPGGYPDGGTPPRVPPSQTWPEGNPARWHPPRVPPSQVRMERGSQPGGTHLGVLPARSGWGYPSQGGSHPGYPPGQVRMGGTPARGVPAQGTPRYRTAHGVLDKLRSVGMPLAFTQEDCLVSHKF